MLLTIGMATYDDFDGVYFSIQALRMYHDLTDCEILVVDSQPERREDLENFCRSAGAKYIKAPHLQGTSAPRQAVFDNASGDFVVCIDCHVLLEKDVISKLKEYIKQNPESKDLLQGPLWYDDLRNVSSHFEPVWNDHMWGTWNTDPKVYGNDPFDIPMQGLGMFGMKRSAWPGFNKLFRGFGGEEGYIHEKVRQRGGRSLCFPWMKWVHRFNRPHGVKYRLTLEDRIFNYIIGHQELDMPLSPIINHFKDKIAHDKLIAIMTETAKYDAKGQMLRGSVAAMTAARKMKCISLGPVIERADCNCSAKFIHSCEKHGKCRTLINLGDNIRNCQECADYEPEDPVES